MKIKDRNYDYIDFEVISEAWNLYALEDGVIVKFKLALIKVMPVTQGKGYTVNSANVVGVLVPKELKKTPSPPIVGKHEIEKKDVNYEILEEKWNEYKLEDRTILKIKPAILGIDKTKSYDSNGEPIYIVHSQPLVKI